MTANNKPPRIAFRLSLYDDNGKYTPAGSALCDAAYSAIRPLFRMYVDMGYSFREISQIIQMSVIDEELNNALCVNNPPVALNEKQTALEVQYKENVQRAQELLQQSASEEDPFNDDEEDD
jgi:hypothetical protein